MRLVLWQSDERVDLPDLTAMSSLVLGEFRRLARTLISGDEGKYIVRGFAVEPESPVSDRVRVRLAPVSARAIAIGAENVDGDIDYGQLIGDRDSSFISEGQAQQLLDFGAEPTGDYTVELRFTYAEGESDNRAFINPATLTESVQTVDTRSVSGWEVRYVSGTVGTGDEWIKLGVVTWGGTTISAGDIEDARVFFFEGTAGAFDGAAQTDDAVEDFSRSTDRAANGVTNIHDALRAVQRQIHDIKGPDDSGLWNWYGRVFSPLDPSNALGDVTKSMRSIDTVTYTIGDGVTTWGDFNGATGLESCLDHIESMDALATCPSRIEIVLKANSTFTWNITGAHQIDGGRTLVIRTQHAPNGSSGRANVQFQHADGTYGIVMDDSGTFIGENVAFTWNNSNDKGGISATNLRLTNCTVTGPNDAATTTYALIADSTERLAIRSCYVRGRVAFWNSVEAGFPENYGGIIEGSYFEDCLVRLTAPSASAVDNNCASNLLIRHCQFDGKTSSLYSDSVGAVVDARGAQNVHFENCDVLHHADEDGIQLARWTADNARNVLLASVRGSTIAAHANGAHAINGGAGGTLGTGWGVRVSGNTADPTSPASSVSIIDNTFRGTGYRDAGGVLLYNATDCSARGNRCTLMDHANVASASVTGIKVAMSAADSECRITLSDNIVSRWFAGATTKIYRGIDIVDARFVTLSGNILEGSDFDGDDITLAAGSRALGLNGVSYLTISGNVVASWNNGVAQSTGIVFLDAGTKASHSTFIGNSFRANGAFSIACGAGSIRGCTFVGNSFFGSTSCQGIFMDPGAYNTFIGNSFSLPSGVGAAAIDYGNSPNNTVIGNVVNTGGEVSGNVTSPGYNDTPDLNVVEAYT